MGIVFIPFPSETWKGWRTTGRIAIVGETALPVNEPNPFHCPVCRAEGNCHPFPRLPFFGECRECGLLFQVCPPDSSSLNRVYEDDLEDTSAQRIVSEEDKRGVYYETLYRRISGYLPEKGRLLEIGCGAGGLLERFIKTGWDCEAIEPSKRLRSQVTAYAGGSVPVHSRHLEDVGASLQKKPYHVIIAIDVVEHLADPWVLPRYAFDWLIGGGLLVIQTPNAGSLRRRLQKERWEQLAPEEHLFLHTKKSLSHLLGETGFSEVRVRSVSGSTVDSPFRRSLMKPIGKGLDWGNLGGGLWATARKGKA